MKLASHTYTALFAALVASAITLNAASLDLINGTHIEGEIVKVLNSDVTVSDSTGSTNTVAITDLNPASKKAIKAWKRENPSKSDVYTKWDNQPVIISSTMPKLPEQLLASDFKGMTSVELILDEKGYVLHATVAKSTHAELEGPSLEATKSWKFEPAQIGGKAVKSKLRVPFKFSHTIPKETVQDHVAGYSQSS